MGKPDTIEAIRREYVDADRRRRARKITAPEAVAIRENLEARLAILTHKEIR